MIEEAVHILFPASPSHLISVCNIDDFGHWINFDICQRISMHWAASMQQKVTFVQRWENYVSAYQSKCMAARLSGLVTYA